MITAVTTSTPPGSEPIDTSNMATDFWSWSADTIPELPDVEDDTTDNAVLQFVPQPLDELTCDQIGGASWVSTGAERPNYSYLVKDVAYGQRISRVVVFNAAENTHSMTIDLGESIPAMTVFIVANVNANSYQNNHCIIDTDYTNNPTLENRALLMANPGGLIAGTELVSNMHKAAQKIVLPQEYSIIWGTDKPVVYYVRFTYNRSEVGAYYPGGKVVRSASLDATDAEFRYLTLGRPYDGANANIFAEMTLYGLAIVPDYLSRSGIENMAANLSSQYRLEELWT